MTWRSLALGGITKGVSNMELTAAYAAIANGGVYTTPRFFTKILDHDGNVLINNEPETRQVLKDSTAFLLTDAMADSMKQTGNLRVPAYPSIPPVPEQPCLECLQPARAALPPEIMISGL